MKHIVVIVALVVIGACNSPWHPAGNCKRTGEACAGLGDCCSFGCLGGVCECANRGQQCQVDEACCSGMVCTAGECTAGCRKDGAACDYDEEPAS